MLLRIWTCYFACLNSSESYHIMIYVALENVRSLQNVGAIFRSCSFFGIQKVILIGISGIYETPGGNKILNDKVSKSSLGTENELDLTFLDSSEDFIRFANENSLKIYCVEQSPSSIKLPDYKPEDNVILVFGTEVLGVSKTLLDSAHKIIEIPRKGIHGSLNVATTCGIVLAHQVGVC